MAEVKWIKLSTNMFEDEKIDYIESLPDADVVIVIWVKLLCLAGKCNSGGYIFLTENIPYTEEMLVHKFSKSVTTIKYAMSIFKRLQMIEIDENGIFITNFNKHQSLDKLESIKEYNRLAKQKSRERQKLLLECQGNVKDSQTENQGSQETDKDKDIDIDKDIDKKKTTKQQGFNLIIDTYTSNLDLKNTIINFIQMRKAIKATMTDNALKLLLSKLNKIAENDNDKISILEQSIMNSWKGIFALKEVNYGGARQNTTESKGKWAGYKPKESTTKPLTDAEIAELDLV